MTFEQRSAGGEGASQEMFERSITGRSSKGRQRPLAGDVYPDWDEGFCGCRRVSDVRAAGVAQERFVSLDCLRKA